MAWQGLICVISICLTAPAMAIADNARFSIGARPLPEALKTFAEQAHMQLLYQSSSVKGLIAQPIEGDLEKHAALESLLRGTGLEAVYSTDNAATIRPLRHLVPAAAGSSLTGDANSRDADRNAPTQEVTKPRKSFFRLAQAGTESGVGPASVTDDNGIPVMRREVDLRKLLLPPGDAKRASRRCGNGPDHFTTSPHGPKRCNHSRLAIPGPGAVGK